MTDDSRQLNVTVVLVSDGYASTAVGPIEVFSAAGRMWNEMSGGTARPRFRVTMASIDGAPIESAYGLTIAPDCGIEAVERADLVFVSASGPLPEEWMVRHQAVLPWLRRQRAEGALLAGVCSGVAFLAEAGLLDGRQATTHWGTAENFRQRYPGIDWRTDLLITEDAGLFCGGGVNAATDLALYLVERLCGHQTAVECAKALILDLPRQHQSGYAFLPISRPHDDARIRAVEEHLHANMAADLAIDAIAREFGMSRRTLIRRFKAATGTVPATYLQRLRVAAARRLLEDGAPSISRVAEAVGYGDQASFRRVFKQLSGMTPADYRQRYRLRFRRPGEGDRQADTTTASGSGCLA
ncbi:MAG: helix-turn-helix domain-containing protein [Azospirillaceae bacterium]